MEALGADEERTLVYGAWGDQLIFVPERKAEDLAALHRAVRRSETWGDFKKNVPEREWALLMNRLRDFIAEDGYEIPPDDEPFDPDMIPGYADGDWPAWLAQEMLDWIPKEVQREYGQRDSSMLNGFFLRLDPQHEREIVAALEERGYQCRKDDRLIALGYGETPGGEHSSIPA